MSFNSANDADIYIHINVNFAKQFSLRDLSQYIICVFRSWFRLSLIMRLPLSWRLRYRSIRVMKRKVQSKGMGILSLWARREARHRGTLSTVSPAFCRTRSTGESMEWAGEYVMNG